MKTLMLMTLLTAGATAQTCQFRPVPLDVQYLGHAAGTMAARFRVEVPVEGCGFNVLARDPVSGHTETWWTSGCEESGIPAPTRIFDAATSAPGFSSGKLVLELWSGNYANLCSSTGPISILPYVDGAFPYGPIMTGANRATLQADSLDATNQGSDLLVRVSGAAAGDQGVIVVSQRLAFESLLGGTMLVHPGYVTGVVNITADQKGEASLMIFGPVTTDLPRLYLQAAFGSSQLSNGLRLDLRFPQ